MQKSLNRLRNDPNSPVLFAAAGGFLFIVVAALGGAVQHYFSGEEFFILHYANGLDHVAAWQRYFFENGRIIESLYWTYLYKIFGYNPLLEHSLSFIQLLMLAVFASLCFLNVWPAKDKNKSLPYLLVFLFLTNWVSISLAFKLSTDNGRISLIFFFLSGLALQRWARFDRVGWLVGCLLLFLLSVFTYENAALLFPALLLLAWPLRLSEKKSVVRKNIAKFAGLAGLSGLSLFLPYLLYGYISRTHLSPIAHPALEDGLSGDFLNRIVDSAPKVFTHFGQFGNFGVGWLNTLVSGAVLSVLLLSVILAVQLITKKVIVKPADRVGWLCIYFASLWFILFGMLPYIAIGYGVEARVYSSAIFGLFPLLLFVNQQWKNNLVRVCSIVLILLFAGFGLIEFVNRSNTINGEETAHNVFYRGLKEIVPFVKPHTVFVFLDYPLSNSGCGPSLEMLYDQDDLNCAFFSSTDYEYRAVRYETEILANRGGGLRNQNWILIGVDPNDHPYLISELKPGDYDLIITWASEEPIQTDYSKIVFDELPPVSQFYKDLLRREGQLFP